MAGSPSPLAGYPSLSADQQKLLLAALTSNSRNRQLNMDQFRNSFSENEQQSSITSELADKSNRAASEGVDPSVLDSMRSQDFAASVSSQPTFGEGLIPDFVNGNTDFDVDVDLPGNDEEDFSFDSYGDLDSGEKRKSPEDDEDEDEDGNSKRIHSDDKGPKKPGRKPLTSEPTTKRKAQNRAAQRAFRERKEKHLKDLEQKVEDLEKASESANHENDLLKAQISRLQAEVQDYRKRLSAAGTALNGSPSPTDSSRYRSGSSGSGGNTLDFPFDFPIFGEFSPNGSANGASSIFNANNSIVKQESFSRSNSDANTPQNPTGFFSKSSSPQNVSSIESPQNLSPNYGSNGEATGLVNFGDAAFNFTSIVASPQGHANGNTSATSANSRNNSTQVQSNSESSTSNAASPSNSSVSHHGPGSSAATSPEPVNNQSNGDFSSLNKIGLNGNLETFASYRTQMPMQSMANPANSNPGPAPQEFNLDFDNFQFDPSLFGSYRETQEAIIGDGEFSGGLYDDYLNFGGFDSHTTNNNNVSKKNTPAPLQSPQGESEPSIQSYDKNVSNVPTKLEEQNMMTCHKMWEQLSTCPKFKQGELDIDSLCSELSKKATCSERGAVIPKAEWEAALWRLVGQDKPDGESSTGALAMSKNE